MKTHTTAAHSGTTALAAVPSALHAAHHFQRMPSWLPRILFCFLASALLWIAPSTSLGQLTGLSGSVGSQKGYRLSVPSGWASMEIKISGGTGDCDLYVKRGSAPMLTSYDYRPYKSGNNETVTVSNPATGDWFIMLHGYSAYSGVTLAVNSIPASMGTAAPPTFSPPGGSYSDSVSVSINSATSGATIRYTTNGSNPTNSSNIYSGSLTLNSSATLKARAFKSGMNDSGVTSASYTITTPSATTLTNNQSVSGISGSQGNQRFYRISVPSGQATLEFKISGGSGDCDLYVRRGSQPTLSSYDYRPYEGGNEETVSINNPVSGDWYVMLNGFSSYSGLSQTVSYASSSGYALKLPLPGGHSWRCTVQAGGLSYDGGTDDGHTNQGNNYYSLDFSWKTLTNTWSNIYPPSPDIPIYAMHSGKVIALGTSNQDALYKAGNGYSLRIDEDKDGRSSTGFVSTYIHLKYPPEVAGGSNISAGTIIGYMGTTPGWPYSTGVHLHLKMTYNGQGTYTNGQGTPELEKVTIEGIKIRDFQVNTIANENKQPGYYFSTR